MRQSGPPQAALDVARVTTTIDEPIVARHADRDYRRLIRRIDELAALERLVRERLHPQAWPVAS